MIKEWSKQLITIVLLAGFVAIFALLATEKTINWKATARRNSQENLLVNIYEREGMKTFIFILYSINYDKYEDYWKEYTQNYGFFSS